MHTLRARLVLSHLLPLLLILPLLGLSLIYVLETRVFLPALVGDMTRQAELVAAFAAAEPEFGSSPAAAQRFVEKARIGSIESILLVDRAGAVLASSAPENLPTLSEERDEVLAGQSRQEIGISRARQTGIATVWVPVRDGRGQIVGALRLTHLLPTLRDDLTSLRYWILALLLLALSVGATIGTLLAFNLGRPIEQVTRAVVQLASGERPGPLPERGPEEMSTLQAAINSLSAQLRTLEAGRRRLLANLVHELGRPLGAMQAAVQALRGGAAEEPALREELLAGIEGEVKRLGRLVDSLAQLHDHVLGTLKLEYELIVPGEWLPAILTPWRAAAGARQLHWHTDLPAELPVLHADPDRLAQVVGNLLANAIKYTPPGGTVAVQAGATASRFWIRVADSGPGIAPDEQARIFEAHYRSSAQTRFPQGMGLGLTIAREIALAHGGEIAVESGPGHGARFTLSLPISLP